MTGDALQSAMIEIVRRVCALAEQVREQTAELEALRGQLTAPRPKPDTDSRQCRVFAGRD